MCIVLLLDEILYKLSVRSIWSMVSFNSEVSLLIFFCLDDLSIGDSGVLKSPTIIVLGSICAFNSSGICLMKLGGSTLGTNKLTIVISS
jgi:hypothetical protein